ncbi:MAG: hypothetical protein ACE5L6_03330 [Candidatus Bathyarchaeia archaeon]
MDELLAIYLLNLVITVAMFVVLVFRAWVEFKNYRIMWREMEWRKTYEKIGRILRAERDMFTEVQGGKELYKILCEIFQTPEEA